MRPRLLILTLVAAAVLCSCGANKPVSLNGGPGSFSKEIREARLIERARDELDSDISEVATDEDIIGLGWEWCGALEDGDTTDEVYADTVDRAYEASDYDEDGKHWAEQTVLLARLSMETLCPEAM